MHAADMRRSGAALVAGAVLAVAASPGMAQSLAEVAKKEEARRAAVGAPTKTYTNKDLRPDFTRPAETPPAPAPRAGEAAAPSGGTAPPAAAPSGNTTPGGTSGAKPGEVVQRNDTFNEQYWRGQAESIRRRLDAARKALAQLESANPDPGNARERSRIEAALKKAQAAVKALEEEEALFLTRADANKVPRVWIQ